MALKQFVDAHPGCQVVRPDLVIPALLAGLPAGGALLALYGLISNLIIGDWVAGFVWLVFAATLLVPVVRYGHACIEVTALVRRGHNSIAVDDDKVLLVDAVGNSVEVALDRVIGLEVDGTDARLRTDSELQGVVYTIMFQLFDGDFPGPCPDRFFDAVAPRLRECSPNATIIRHESGEGALIA